MKQFCKIATVFLILYLFSPSHVLAAAQVSINNLPLTVDQSTEFEVDVNFSCPSCGDSYLRGVFYPSGSSYFGFTQDNKGNWSNAPGSLCVTYFKIAQADLNPEGTWSGKIKFKIDKDSSYYSGPGEYSFKIGRYTPSCISPSVWSSEYVISVTGPTPTSTPTSTSVPTTSTPTSTTTTTPTISPTSIEEEGLEEDLQEDSDINFNLSSSPIPQETKSDIKVASAKENPLAKIFLSLGMIMLVSCGIVSFWIYRKNQKTSE